MATLVNERYSVTKKVGKESVTIYFEIDNEDTITIDTHDNKRQFSFTRSNKDRVKAIAQAFAEAAETVENRKIKAA